MLHSADSLGPACVSSSAPEQIELEGYLAINNNDASSYDDRALENPAVARDVLRMARLTD